MKNLPIILATAAGCLILIFSLGAAMRSPQPLPIAPVEADTQAAAITIQAVTEDASTDTAPIEQVTVAERKKAWQIATIKAQKPTDVNRGQDYLANAYNLELMEARPSTRRILTTTVLDRLPRHLIGNITLTHFLKDGIYVIMPADRTPPQYFTFTATTIGYGTESQNIYRILQHTYSDGMKKYVLQSSPGDGYEIQIEGHIGDAVQVTSIEHRKNDLPLVLFEAIALIK